MSESEHELEVASKVADAQLGVAEHLGFYIALLSGSTIHLLWDKWYVSMGAAVCSYMVVTMQYHGRANAAQTAYFKAAGLGAYRSAKRDQQP